MAVIVDYDVEHYGQDGKGVDSGDDWGRVRLLNRHYYSSVSVVKDQSDHWFHQCRACHFQDHHKWEGQGPAFGQSSLAVCSFRR